MGGSFATGLLNISQIFIKQIKNPQHKETKFKSPNTSKINALMLQNIALSTSRVT